MEKTRKKLIKLLKPYMNKELSKGCLIMVGFNGINSGDGISEYYHSYIVEYIGEDTEFHCSDSGDRFEGKTFYSVDDFMIEDEESLKRYSNDDKFYIDEILGYYDISAIWGYLNSINNEKGVGPYYFDSISISKEYYILTPVWDNLEYLKIPNKPLHLFTEEEEKELYNNLIFNK